MAQNGTFSSWDCLDTLDVNVRQDFEDAFIGPKTFIEAAVLERAALLVPNGDAISMAAKVRNRMAGTFAQCQKRQFYAGATAAFRVRRGKKTAPSADEHPAQVAHPHC